MYNISLDDVNYCDALCYKFHAYWGGIPDDDQIQDCREWMCIAADKYDPELSPKFMTYARWWIRGAVAKHYVRTYNGYPKYSDVFYQGLHVSGDPDNHTNPRLTSSEYEKKELVEKLVATMPKDVEIALKRHAEGERYSDIMRDTGYKYSRQNFNQRIETWRKKQGIHRGEEAIA